jgi:hypothetical protein
MVVAVAQSNWKPSAHRYHIASAIDAWVSKVSRKVCPSTEKLRRNFCRSILAHRCYDANDEKPESSPTAPVSQTAKRY